jgi:thioredoxin 1
MKARNLLSACLLFFIIFSAGCSDASGIDGRLDKAKKEGKAVMLELGSVGCIPCEQMRPIMDRLRQNYGSNLEVIFVDIKQDRDTGRRFNVFMIPTQVFLDKSGKEFHRHMGFYPYEEIDAMLKQKGL